MDPPAPPPTTKLRLMCSYGGYIVPRPQTKSLCYAGGDNRIISLKPAATTSVTALTGHLSATLSVPTPFFLKYQLPLHDLDSLISLSSDDDLLIFLDEFHRSSSSPTPSRIRLFLFKPTRQFTTRPELTQPMIQHPKTEAWFVDALKGAKIMQKGQNCVLGFDGEGQNEGLGGGELGNFGISVQESMLLETNSSFGSTSSSASSSNLPPIKGIMEDGAVNLQDNNVKLAEPKSNASDNSVASALSYQQTGLYQEPVVQVASMENRVASNPFESESICDPASEIHMQKTIQASGYPFSAQLGSQLQQKPQLVQAGAHYIPQYPIAPLPTTSYHNVYHPQMQQQQLHYQPNQPYPIYFVPVGPTEPCNLPMHCGLTDTATNASSRPPIHPNATLVPTKVAYKEVTTVPPVAYKEVTTVPPELHSQVFRTSLAATPPVHAPSIENQQQFGGLTQMRDQPQSIGITSRETANYSHQPQSIGITSRETANYSNEFDDDISRVQIYKSQPPPPILPSQYQTKTKATRLLLSDALAQLHTDNTKQHIRSTHPQ